MLYWNHEKTNPQRKMVESRKNHLDLQEEITSPEFQLSMTVISRRAATVDGRSQLEFFKEHKDNSGETIIAWGDCLSAIEEN